MIFLDLDFHFLTLRKKRYSTDQYGAGSASITEIVQELL